MRKRWDISRTAPLGILLALVGYWGPWVDHQTAALVLSGLDMSEYVKFLPEVREGSVRVFRELFYLPPLAAALCLALLVGRLWPRYPLAVRVIMLSLAVGLCIVVLPPYPFVPPPAFPTRQPDTDSAGPPGGDPCRSSIFCHPSRPGPGLRLAGASRMGTVGNGGRLRFHHCRRRFQKPIQTFLVGLLTGQGALLSSSLPSAPRFEAGQLIKPMDPIAPIRSIG